MPELSFSLEGSEAPPYSAAPLIALKLRITSSPDSVTIHSILLRCQVQIEPVRRQYLPEEKLLLHDLFGEPSRWSRTLRPLLWMNTSLVVPAFTGNITVNLELPCTFDFNLAATKYFNALTAGDIPLCVMFSGTIFYKGPEDAMQVAQIPWDREANFRLPVSTWKNMMDFHYPNAAWLCLERDTFAQLFAYKMRHGLPTWEQAIARALASEVEPELQR